MGYDTIMASDFFCCKRQTGHRHPAEVLSRREFAIGAAILTGSLPVSAQRLSPSVGYVYVGSDSGGRLLGAFRKGLNDRGYVEGRNVELQLRFVENQNGPLPQIMGDLVRRQVAVIVTPDSGAATLAAKAATKEIPIVFGVGGDPVAQGFVSALNRPDGNLTGVTFLNVEIASKRVEILYELVPRAERIAVLVNPNSSGGDALLSELRPAAYSLRRQIDVFYASNADEIDVALANLARSGCKAIIVQPDAFFANNSERLVKLSLRYSLPAIYGGRVFTEIGGLVSYGDKRSESFRDIGVYTGRILNGEKVASLPVMRATKFELIFNLRTARILGLNVSCTLLALADEVLD
jgi:putative ABC transport system substrate-binding protein